MVFKYIRLDSSSLGLINSKMVKLAMVQALQVSRAVLLAPMGKLGRQVCV